ncbi:MAG: methyltransferase domain-containing protein, partial [Patescibacteria group bacterium]
MRTELLNLIYAQPVHETSSERDISIISDVTIASHRVLLPTLVLPENLEGHAFLEVGAGISDLTEELNMRGARALATDPLYESQKKVNDAMQGVFEAWGRDDYITEALQRFKKSKKEHPDRYIPAFASSLPFQDEVFDSVISTHLFSAYLDLNYEVLESSMRECLRVLKQGGLFQVYPWVWQTDYGDGIDEVRLKNGRKVLKALRKQGMIEEPIIEPVKTDEGSRVRLLLTKP